MTTFKIIQEPSLRGLQGFCQGLFGFDKVASVLCDAIEQHQKGQGPAPGHEWCRNMIKRSHLWLERALWELDQYLAHNPNPSHADLIEEVSVLKEIPRDWLAPVIETIVTPKLDLEPLGEFGDGLRRLDVATYNRLFSNAKSLNEELNGFRKRWEQDGRVLCTASAMALVNKDLVKLCETVGQVWADIRDGVVTDKQTERNPLSEEEAELLVAYLAHLRREIETRVWGLEQGLAEVLVSDSTKSNRKAERSV